MRVWFQNGCYVQVRVCKPSRGVIWEFQDAKMRDGIAGYFTKSFGQDLSEISRV